MCFFHRLSRTAIAEGGSLAEEVIAAVRTAQAFGIQAKLSEMYDRHMHHTFVADAKGAVWHGGCSL